MTVSHTESADAATPGRRRTGVRLALLAAPTGVALATALLAAVPASADTGGSTTGQIIGYTQLCLDDQGGGTANFNPVQVFGCNGSDAQQWTLNEAGSTVQAFGKCLDVQYGGTTDGTTVDLYDCNGTGAQVWIPQADGALYNPQSNKCLDDTNWSAVPGWQVQIWDCTGAANQTWAPGQPWENDPGGLPGRIRV